MRSTIRFLLVLFKSRRVLVTTTIVAAISYGSLHFHVSDVDVSYLF